MAHTAQQLDTGAGELRNMVPTDSPIRVRSQRGLKPLRMTPLYTPGWGQSEKVGLKPLYMNQVRNLRNPNNPIRPAKDNNAQNGKTGTGTVVLGL